MISCLSRLFAIALLVWPALTFGQTKIIVYDGYTGIFNTSIQNDTASVTSLLPGSPAEKAGIKLRDQIIAINDSAISGRGVGQGLLLSYQQWHI
ncbi:MAG: PDZ domain-containing protein [Bacteroidales bacterium]|nr:PDZ domain-containing protein [Bacteroidales bacterium]